jgi:hypothetical protein
MSSAQRDRYAFASQEDRSAPRLKLSIPATLRPAGSKRLQTVLRDLSLSGFSASAIDRIPVGTTCWLTLPDREAMQAHVVWWDRGLVGCAFETLIAQVSYDAILERWQAESSRR